MLILIVSINGNVLIGIVLILKLLSTFTIYVIIFVLLLKLIFISKYNYNRKYYNNRNIYNHHFSHKSM